MMQKKRSLSAPVSYTHLDVYKRQPLHYAPDSFMHNVWAKVMHVNQIPKFKRFYWDTDGKQLK